MAFTRLKLHLCVDEATSEIVSALASTNNVSDAEVLSDLLEEVPGKIEQVSADGAYDQRKCYDDRHCAGGKTGFLTRQTGIFLTLSIRRSGRTIMVRPNNLAAESSKNLGTLRPNFQTKVCNLIQINPPTDAQSLFCAHGTFSAPERLCPDCTGQAD